jgi:hypothetical protein
MTPAVERGAHVYTAAMPLVAVLLAVLRTRVAHPAGADVGAGVMEPPLAVGRRQPALPFRRRSVGEIADDMIGCMLRFGGEIAAGNLNPERSVGVGARQGGASRGLSAPARYPRMRTDRGCGVSTESRALLHPLFTSQS